MDGYHQISMKSKGFWQLWECVPHGLGLSLVSLLRTCVNLQAGLCLILTASFYKLELMMPSLKKHNIFLCGKSHGTAGVCLIIYDKQKNPQ